CPLGRALAFRSRVRLRLFGRARPDTPVLRLNSSLCGTPYPSVRSWRSAQAPAPCQLRTSQPACCRCFSPLPCASTSVCSARLIIVPPAPVDSALRVSSCDTRYSPLIGGCAAGREHGRLRHADRHRGAQRTARPRRIDITEAPNLVPFV